MAMATNHHDIRVLHVWDMRVDSGINIDDLLENTPLTQRAISRILVRQGSPKQISQSQQYQLDEISSPYPQQILKRMKSHRKYKKLVEIEIEKFNPDIIFFHFGQTAARFIKLALKHKKPFIIALYGHDISVATRQLRWKIKYRLFARTNGRFLVLAEDIKHRLSTMGVQNSRVFVYNFPINLIPYLKVIQSPQRGPFRITIPGRMVEKKGHPYLFNAVQQLKEESIPVSVTVIGYGNQSALRKLAIDLDISDQLTWIDTASATIKGEFDQIYSQVLSETDLVVLPCITSSEGDNEAGPALVLCLAQAAGIPVLTTAFEGHEISIEDGKSGLLAMAGESEDLKRQIIWATEHPGELQKIAENGKNRVQEVFNLESNLRLLLEIISLDFPLD
jgi:glycosyltransferase involved in cell wall biosynthesis